MLGRLEDDTFPLKARRPGNSFRSYIEVQTVWHYSQKKDATPIFEHPSISHPAIPRVCDERSSKEIKLNVPEPKNKNNSPSLHVLSSVRNSKHRTPLKIHRSNVSASGREDKTRAIQMVCRHL